MSFNTPSSLTTIAPAYKKSKITHDEEEFDKIDEYVDENLSKAGNKLENNPKEDKNIKHANRRTPTIQTLPPENEGYDEIYEYENTHSFK